MPEPATRTAYRIAGYYAISFAVASLLLGAATWGFTRATLRSALDERLRNELATLVRAGAREGRAALIADIVARDSVPGAGGYILVDRGGRRIAGKTAAQTPAPGLSNLSLSDGHGGDLPARAASARLESGETLAVIGEAASLGRVETTLLLISAAGFGLMVAIGVAGGFLIGHSIHRRLSAVDAAARAIIEGDPSRRMPIGARDDEFDRLSATLNTMLDHIGLLMDSLRHVSDDIAHDLRTPLARLRATLENAGEADRDGDLRQGMVAALAQTDALMALFTTILRISEVERGGIRAHFGEVRLDLLASEILETYQPVAFDAQRELEASIDRDITVDGDEMLLGQAIVNLIENAIKHTPSGTRVTLMVSRANGQALLSVVDDGPGVPAEDHPAILRRFGRRDASRATPGHGLGLTLVAAIAAAHKAKFVLGDAAPGLSASLKFPAKFESLQP